MTTKRLANLSTLLLTLALAPAALTDDFDLSWWTIDGGGEMWTTGGDFELSGTIGQPDAGVMTGGDFALTGGFWPGATDSVSLPGDCDEDGDVDLVDFEAFLGCVTGPDGGPVSPECACFDFNDDDDVDFADFADLQGAFTG